MEVWMWMFALVSRAGGVSSALSRADPIMNVDTMHGVGVGYLDALLDECGAGVIRIRHELDLGFGGTNPEPVAQNLQPLKVAVREH